MKRPLRIAMLMFSDPSEAGGVQECVYRLSSSLQQRGHRVDIFGPKAIHKLPFHSYVPSMNVFSVPNLYGHWSKWTVDIPGEVTVVDRILAGSYDIIHIQDPFVPFVSWSVIASSKMPIVCQFNTSWDTTSNLAHVSSVFPILTPLYAEKVDASIFISSASKTCWLPLTGSKGLVDLIPYGTNPEIRMHRKAPFNGRPINFLFVARLVPRKGILNLLSAFLTLKEKNYPFILDIVGDGQDREKMKKYIVKYKLDTQVYWHGEIIGPKKYSFFNKADVFCAPYTDEAFGLTYTEAMSAGLPVVGYANEATDEVLHGYPGKNLLVGPKDPHALALAIGTCIDHPEMIPLLSRWCLKRAKQYDWNTVAQKTENVYMNVLAKRK